MTTEAPPETNGERWARERAERAERWSRERAERDAKAQAELVAAEEAHGTQRPHLMHLGVDSGARVRVDCPGKDHCMLWFEWPGGGNCGFQAQIEDIGYEMLEYHLGPEFWPTTNPFPVRFRWTHCGEDEPVEITWWPVSPDDSPAVADGDHSELRGNG